MPDRPSGRWAILKGNIGVMLLSSGFWNLASAMTWPFYSLYVLELGGSHIDIGLISAMGAVARIAPTFLGGYLADALGRKKILYTMSFLLAGNELILAFAPDYRYLYLVAVLQALISGIRDPSFSSILADSTAPENRAFSLALWQVVPPLFGLFSPYAIGLVMDAHGIVTAMRWAYMFTFGMGLVASTLRYLFVEETLVNDREDNGDLRVAPKEILGDFRETLSRLSIQLWVFLAIDFVFTFAWALAEPYFVTYAREEVGVTAAQWGLATMLMILVRTMLKPPAAVASDRHGRIKFMLPCMFLSPVAFILFVNSGGFHAVLLAQLMMATLGSIGDPAWEALFVDYVPREYRGRFNAIASICWSLIWGTGNAAGGAVYQNYSKRLIFNLSAGLLIIGSFAALLRVKEPEERER